MKEPGRVWRRSFCNSPRSAENAAAETLSKSGRARDAIPLHEKAISLGPESFFYYNRGVGYLVLGNSEKALEQKEKLLQLDPLAANRLAILIAKHPK